MLLRQTSDVKNFPFFITLSESQQDVLSLKLLGVMKEDRRTPERLDVNSKVPYASHFQNCIFHSRLKRSSPA